MTEREQILRETEKYEARIARFGKAYALMLATLRRLEWSWQARTKCPLCGCPRTNGHAVDCDLAIAIARAVEAYDE